MYWLLLYDLAGDYLERREALRPEHLSLAQAAHERGELVLAGAVPDPFDLAVLVFKGDDQSIVERFVDEDPYVREGLVKAWRIRRWNVVIGG